MRSSRSGTRLRVIGSLLGAVLLMPFGSLIAEGSYTADDPISARAFEVDFRPLSDIADLIQPLLSEDGIVSMRPRLRTLVVEDHVSVLDRIAGLIESFDLPPRNVEIKLTLVLGMDQRTADEEQSAGKRAADRQAPSVDELSREVRGILETLGDFTRWNAYEPLGNRAVVGAEGERLEVQLSSEYRVVFVIDAVQDGSQKIKLSDFKLQRQVTDAQGRQTIETLYSSVPVLSSGRLQVVGAASGADSDRALFLMLQAEVL